MDARGNFPGGVASLRLRLRSCLMLEQSSPARLAAPRAATLVSRRSKPLADGRARCRTMHSSSHR
eukprot:9679141-Karenia_brevis.AAC.1